MADLSTTYAGLSLKNPLIIGSSGLTDSIEGISTLEKEGAAAIVLKSIFEEEIRAEMQASFGSMQANGFIYPEVLEYYEQLQAPEESTVKYLKLIEGVRKSVSVPVIASINCVTGEQWTCYPRQLESAGASAIELNMFILPTDPIRNTADNEKVYFEVVSEVLSQVKIPVTLKVGPYFSNLSNFLVQLSKTGISGLVLFNKSYNPDFDIGTLEVTAGGVLSNPGDIYNTLRWVAILSDRVECSLAGSTGVHDSAAMIKLLLAGADAVQVVSVLYKEGPGQIGALLKGLSGWMDNKGYGTIDKFKGILSQEKSQNPAAYERVQFMKYFRGYGK